MSCKARPITSVCGVGSRLGAPAYLEPSGWPGASPPRPAGGSTANLSSEKGLRTCAKLAATVSSPELPGSCVRKSLVSRSRLTSREASGVGSCGGSSRVAAAGWAGGPKRSV
eukprot:11472239-Heterocapsa_arctica.AAC.1